MYQPASLFDRFFSRPLALWVKLAVSLSLILLPFLVAVLDGALRDFLDQGQWRVYFLSPTIIIYIWLISPIMNQMEMEVIKAMRPLVSLDDEAYEFLVADSSHVNPRNELLAFIVGVMLGILSAMASGFEINSSWLDFYWFISTGFMYGLLIWMIYLSVASTRLNAALHRQQLRIDILDSTQFEAVGRQSLFIALVFIGGITLSLLFAFQPDNLTSPEFWFIYLILVLVTLLIFFLSMRPTHRVLVAEKKRALESVQGHINNACRALVKRLDMAQDLEVLPGEINALQVYEKRLLAARTWPYNTSMLRTLFFSVFIPLGTVLGRLMIEILFP